MRNDTVLDRQSKEIMPEDRISYKHRISQTGFNLSLGAAVISLVIFFAIVYEVFVAHQIGLDMQVSQYFQGFRDNHLLIDLAKAVSFLASEAFIGVVCVMALVLAKVLHKRFVPAISLCLMAGAIGLVELVLKHLFHRPRPFDGLQAISYMSQYSFPSAHSLLVVGFYGFLFYLLVRYHYVQEKTMALALWTGLIVVVGLSRLVLNMHYLSDVTASYLLGIPLLVTAVFLYERREFFSTRSR